MPIARHGRDDGVSLAQRIAGGALLINAIFLAIETIFFSAGAAESRQYSSIVISFGIGILLLVGVRQVLLWAKISVIAGAILFTAQYVAADDVFMVTFQVAFSLGLILLLFGRPHRIRLGIAIALLLMYFSLEVVGLQQEFTGQNVLTSTLVRARNDLEPLKSSHVIGVEVPYIFEVDESRWLAMTQEGVKVENPIVDRWLVQPDYDAHLFTIPEVLGPDEYIELEDLVEAVIANGREGSDKFTINERKALPSHPGTGVYLDATVVIDGEPFRFNYGIYTMERAAIQVVCYSYEESYSHISADCERAIQSFAMR